MHIEDNVVKRFDMKQMDEFAVAHSPVAFAEHLPRRFEIRRLCREKMCCEFSMRYSRSDGPKEALRYFYKLAVSSGKNKQIDDSSKEFYCAVVACTSESSASCGKRFQPSDTLVPSLHFSEIKINMIIELETAENDYLVMPSSVDFSLLPLDTSQFSFERSAVYTSDRWFNLNFHCHSTLNLESFFSKQFINYTKLLKDDSELLLTFGILGRVFHLEELEAEGMEGDIPDLPNMLLSVLIALLVMFAIIKCFKLR
jgi:Vanin C-terminal domain